MLTRTIVACMGVWAFAQSAALAQTAFVPSFGGRVFADGRPVTWVVEVRLEGQDSSVVETAHTRGSSEFSFRNITLQGSSNYFLVVKEPGYRELRFALDPRDFGRDSRSPGILFYKGFISLNIESIPSEERENPRHAAGPKGVDVEQLREQIPNKARQEYKQALRDIAAGKNDAARKHLEKAVDLAPRYNDALNKLGVEYLRAREYRKAQTFLERARSLNPNDSLPVTNLGVLYFEEGERLASTGAGPESEAIKAVYFKAVDLLEEALRLDPLVPRTNFYLGTVLYRIGVYARAESLLINSLALDGQMHQARLALLNLYMRQNRYQDALAQTAAFLAENPDDPQRQQMEKLKTQIENSLRR
jgi:Flp pilus assembly protein TadD